MAQAKRDENFVTSTLLIGSTGETFPWEGDETTGRAYVDIPGAGSGTVTLVSVVTANGFAGSVATATTTPAITLSTTVTGVLYGNGTSVAAATGGQLPVMTATVGGAVPTPPNNTTTFLRGDGTFATPSAAVPTTITVANEATDTTCFLGFFTAASGDLGPKTNANLAFNSNTGVLTLTAPVLGTPTSGTLTNCTGFPTAQLAGLGTGVATALAINVGSAGAFVTFNGALGTPSSGTVTNLTGTASININGTVGATTPTTGVFTTLVAGSTTSLLLGTAGSAVGNVGFRNATSGTITLAPVAGALGTVTLSLPARTDTLVTLAGTEVLTNKTLTSPTINAASVSGILQMAENTSLTLDASLSADGTWSGVVIAGTAGATLAFGDLIYLSAADSRWELADADSVTTAGPVLLGMCVLAAAADGSATNILLQGNIRADAAFPALTISAPVYVGTTAGDIQVAAPSGDNDVVRIVGQALTADSIYFNPSTDWVVLVV